MNGYMRAVQRIASAHPDIDADASSRELRLLQWIRAMSSPKNAASQIVSDNVVTLRADRDAVDKSSDVNGRALRDHSTVDAAVSFILNVLFDGNRSKAEIRIARAMFRPGASIVLIPRERPSLACAVGVDEFFAVDKEMLQYEDTWEEAWRIHDPFPDNLARMRIRAQILLDPHRDVAKPRSTEVVFALRNTSSAQRIHSCTILYDEGPRTCSPVTLFA